MLFIDLLQVFVQSYLKGQCCISERHCERGVSHFYFFAIDVWNFAVEMLFVNLLLGFNKANAGIVRLNIGELNNCENLRLICMIMAGPDYYS